MNSLFPIARPGSQSLTQPASRPERGRLTPPVNLNDVPESVITDLIMPHVDGASLPQLRATAHRYKRAVDKYTLHRDLDALQRGTALAAFHAYPSKRDPFFFATFKEPSSEAYRSMAHAFALSKTMLRSLTLAPLDPHAPSCAGDFPIMMSLPDAHHALRFVYFNAKIENGVQPIQVMLAIAGARLIERTMWLPMARWYFEQECRILFSSLPNFEYGRLDQTLGNLHRSAYTRGMSGPHLVSQSYSHAYNQLEFFTRMAPLPIYHQHIQSLQLSLGGVLNLLLDFS